MFRDGWKYLASLDNLAGRDARVLFALLERLDYENWVAVSQETLAEELGLRQPHVAAAIKKLTQYQILEREKDPADKRRWMYRFNASLGWKGDASQWARYMKGRTGTNVTPLPGILVGRRTECNYPKTPKDEPQGQ
jgi:predicted transcriptional regulator